MDSACGRLARSRSLFSPDFFASAHIFIPHENDNNVLATIRVYRLLVCQVHGLPRTSTRGIEAVQKCNTFLHRGSRTIQRLLFLRGQVDFQDLFSPACADDRGNP